MPKPRLGTLLLTVLSLLPALPGAESKPVPPEEERFRLSDLLPRPLQKNPRLNLSIVTEMTKEGKALPVPTKDHPAYYLAWDGGMVEEGDVVAGEKPPPTDRLAEIMRSSLASSGYLPASNKDKPSVIVHYRWGSFNHLSAISDDDESSGQPEDTGMLKNLMARAALVGGTKFAVDFMRAYNSHFTAVMENFRLRDDRSDLLTTMALSDLYFLLAVAYDYDSATHGIKKVLWITKISTDSQGLAMDETLPSLVARAGTYFGHETDGAVVFHPRLLPGHVEIGPAVVKGYGEAPPMPEAKPASDQKSAPPPAKKP